METKVCSKCDKEKSLSEFHKLPHVKSGKHPRCKECRNSQSREYYNKNKETMLERNRKNKKKSWRFAQYGVKHEVFLQMMELRKGCCDICGQHYGEKLCVDHNHTTGEVRGLLCRACNWGIGQLQESVPILQKAIKYLEDWGSSNPLSC